jgi:hypothetical protein
MGRKFDEVPEEAKRIPYKIVRASNGAAHVEVVQYWRTERARSRGLHIRLVVYCYCEN